MNKNTTERDDAAIYAESAERITEWLNNSDAVLIGAGAGLSAAAGFDYTDEASFAKNYPALLQYGFRRKTDMMGYGRMPKELQWGYYLANVQEVRFSETTQPTYTSLLSLVTQRKHFVITTNVDGLFERNGFNADFIYTPQGDYANMQCSRPCTETVWSTKDEIDRLLPLVNPETGYLPKGKYPVCPHCGADAVLNVRAGHWFIEHPYESGAQRFSEWISNHRSSNLLILDIGSGFNTPMWVRRPCETLVRNNPRAHLVRINLHHHSVPEDIAERSISFAAGADHVIEAITIRSNAALS